MAKHNQIDLVEFPAADSAALRAARAFYESAFGWGFTDYGEYLDTADSGTTTGINAVADEHQQRMPLVVALRRTTSRQARDRVIECGRHGAARHLRVPRRPAIPLRGPGGQRARRLVGVALRLEARSGSAARSAARLRDVAARARQVPSGQPRRQGAQSADGEIGDRVVVADVDRRVDERVTRPTRRPPTRPRPRVRTPPSASTIAPERHRVRGGIRHDARPHGQDVQHRGDEPVEGEVHERDPSTGCACRGRARRSSRRRAARCRRRRRARAGCRGTAASRDRAAPGRRPRHPPAPTRSAVATMLSRPEHAHRVGAHLRGAARRPEECRLHPPAYGAATAGRIEAQRASARSQRRSPADARLHRLVIGCRGARRTRTALMPTASTVTPSLTRIQSMRLPPALGRPVSRERGPLGREAVRGPRSRRRAAARRSGCDTAPSARRCSCRRARSSAVSLRSTRSLIISAERARAARERWSKWVFKTRNRMPVARVHQVGADEDAGQQVSPGSRARDIRSVREGELLPVFELRPGGVS